MIHQNEKKGKAIIREQAGKENAPSVAIVEALKILTEPGQVIELRIPNAERRGNRTDAGYFDNIQDLAKLGDMLGRGQSQGVYFTLNVVNPALLARSANRVTRYAKNLTQDSDILYRQWLPIDMDPVRPTGISSTKEEYVAALERAAKIRAWLTDRGWPSPLSADSGNGAHLLYRLPDLPNTDENKTLIQRCLEVLAMAWDDDTVVIDQTVFNAGRIWKLYGTLAAKGDHTEDRPHRLSRILETPDTIAPVTEEQLQALAAMLPEPAKTPTTNRTGYKGTATPFDLAAFIHDHGLDVGPPRGWNNGKKWIFNVCPWNPDHTDKSAYLLQFSNGAISAGCHHNGCNGQDWRSLRENFDGPKEERSRGQAPQTHRNGTGPHTEGKTPEALGLGVGNEDPAAMFGGIVTETPPWGDNEEFPTVHYADHLQPTDEQSNVGWVAIDETAMPELPKSAQLDEGLGAGACQWIDEYERFSRLWSPRGWDDFHAAAGLMALSTVAARRVMLPFGGRRYTNLYISFAASTTLHGKTTTSKIAGDTIRAAGLAHLLTPDDSTPQAFIQTLAENSVTLNPDAPEQVIEAAKQRLLFSGQRGWIFEEFGEKVSSMMRAGSSMAEYRAIFLRFDDNPEKYEYRTIGRGADIVESPYLALLANVTPAYLQPFAGRGAPLWLDGFWARFVFLTPPENAERKRGRFPEGKRIIPSTIIEPLREWHKRLGEPHIAQMNVRKEGKNGNEGVLEGIRLWRDSERHPVNTCTLGSGVMDAYYAYDNALLDIASDNEDLLGNYGRLGEKALRVAMLFASLENDGLIEMKHWAKAQEIAEKWRQNLHNLYTQLTSQVSQTKDRGYQDAIIRQIAKNDGGMTKRELVQKIRGLDAKKAAEILESLVGALILGKQQNGRREEFVVFSPDI
jgi:hypothetical protein